MNLFFNLPKELVQMVYQFDNTYRDKFDEVVFEFSLRHKFTPIMNAMKNDLGEDILYIMSEIVDEVRHNISSDWDDVMDHPRGELKELMFDEIENGVHVDVLDKILFSLI